MGILFNKSKDESKKSTYTGEENRDIFKTPEEVGKNPIEKEQSNDDLFDPAIFYEKLPKRYKGKVDFIRAISVSALAAGTVDPYVTKGRVLESAIDEFKIGLEDEIRTKLSDSEGDLIVLQKPTAKYESTEVVKEVDFENHSILSETNKSEIAINKGETAYVKIKISVNGDLYQTKGVKTSFSRK
jgi:hypothetical protein